MTIRAEAKSTQPVWNDVGIIALIPDKWEPQWQTRHQIISRLARYFHVVWVDEPHRWWECASVLLSRRRRAPDNPPVPANFEVYKPEFWLPILGRSAGLAALTSRPRLARARARLLARGCKRLALYIFRPDFGDVLDDVEHDLSIYHIDDEYSFSNTEVEVSPIERNLLESAGQVFIHSPALLRKKGHFNPHTEFVPNGVDFNLYSTPAPEPEDLRNIPHPRIGYIGVLKRMVDWELLLQLTADRPQWSFVFIGPKAPHPQIADLLRKMAARPNVHFLGGKPADQLGSYEQHLDVCIMPYRVDNYTKYIYPLKMHEYLACGQPVVSARITTVEVFSDVVALASTREEWLKALDNGLSAEENTPQRHARRQEVAAEHDWGVMAYRIARTIAERLGIEGRDSVDFDGTGIPATARLAAESMERVKR